MCFSLWRGRLGATVILRTVSEMSLESGAGGVSSTQWRRVIPSTRLSLVSAVMVAASVHVLVKQHSRRASCITARGETITSVTAKQVKRV